MSVPPQDWEALIPPIIDDIEARRVFIRRDQRFGKGKKAYVDGESKFLHHAKGERGWRVTRTSAAR